MRNIKEGSALIVVMMTLGALLIMATAVWHAVSLAALGAYERQVYSQYEHAARGLLSYAIALCQDSALRLQTYTLPAQPACLDIAAWPCGDHKFCRGRITVFKQQADLMVEATVYGGDIPRITVSCAMRNVYDTSKAAFIDTWQWHAQG